MWQSGNEESNEDVALKKIEGVPRAWDHVPAEGASCADGHVRKSSGKKTPSTQRLQPGAKAGIVFFIVGKGLDHCVCTKGILKDGLVRKD
jgi:hypothetical protein